MTTPEEGPDDVVYLRWLHASAQQRRAMIFEEREWKARMHAQTALRYGKTDLARAYLREADQAHRRAAEELAKAS